MKKQILQRIYDKPYKNDNMVSNCFIGVYMSSTSFISNINKMTKQELEQQKIMLTKEYEKVQKKIDYYWLDKISNGSWQFKELISNREKILRKIKEIKQELEKYDLSL